MNAVDGRVAQLEHKFTLKVEIKKTFNAPRTVAQHHVPVASVEKKLQEHAKS